MGTPIRWIVKDIQTDLKQSFDNRLIGVNQILYWVTVVANRLKYQHIDKLLKKGSWVNGHFLNVFTGIPVLVPTVSVNPNLVAGRKYIQVPASIMDLEYENGVEYITYDMGKVGCGAPAFTMVQFSPTTTGQAPNLYGDPYVSPSPKNPYFYRVDNYLYTLGIENVNVKEVEIGIYTYADPQLICNLDDEINLPEHLIETLKRTVMDLGVFALKIPEHRVNDGSGTIKVAASLNNEVNKVDPEADSTQQQSNQQQ